ncbi:MAG: glutamate dehydrogenase, partial [Actinobacteria bacterium]|nr:glutamate dehydrogenase [Actinomycetota bacterium]
PDMNTNAQTMSWILDQYGRKYGHTTSIVTGKPVALGGSHGREAATGRGCVHVMDEALEDLEIPRDGASVAIQGFGNVGSWAARLAADAGYKVIAVSDVRGGIHAPQGLDLPEVVSHSRETGSVVDAPGTEPISNEDLLELECDVLMPAALGEVLTSANADRVRARIVVEAANHPTTPVADEILADKGVLVVPDILANAGGVTVSYFEWVQNNQEIAWDEADVNSRLEHRMRTAYQECRQFMATHDEARTMREGAFALAVNRVVEAAQLRGYL